MSPSNTRLMTCFQRTVVILDDCPDNVVSTLSLKLERSGYYVHRLGVGKTAPSKAARLRPGAIVLDIRLPDTDGYKLAAALRKKQELRRTLIVGVSGFKRKRDAVPPQGDFDHYFAKPANEEAIVEAIDSHVRGVDPSCLQTPIIDDRPATRLLLVEDHSALGEATAEFLRCLGLEVRLVSSGHEALISAAAFLPDIVVCDMNLPDMTGLDVAQALRQKRTTKDALVAIYTATTETEIRTFESIIEAPAVNLFLSKPLTVEKLDRLLGELQVLRQSVRHRIKQGRAHEKFQAASQSQR